MRRFVLAALAVGLIAPLFAAAPAQAQATRTWVSGVGDDANPCSRTAPCKTFAGSISKTAAGGEINCIDPGGFGAVTITKALTISCEGLTAGVLVQGTNAIIVSAGANDNVVLRGLDIQGLGTGLSGIVFNSGRSLLIDKCLIEGFTAGTAFGILAQPSTVATVNIQDSIVINNGTAAGGGGIAATAQSGGFLRLVLTRTTVNRNFFFGVSATGSAATAQVEIFDSVISNNASNGLNATGTGAIKVGHSIITGNASAATNGNVSSFGNNQIIDNATDNTPPSAGTLK
jgi:hypothetical protein